MSVRQTIRLTDEELEQGAKEAFLELLQRNPEGVMKKCSVVYIPSKEQDVKGKFIVNLLNKTYSVELSSMRVLDLISERPAPPRIKYIILRYLVTGDGTRLGSEWMSYKDIAGASPLLKEFENFVLKRLATSFGSSVEVYEMVCKVLGGRRERLGGISYSFNMLPRVRILCQLWQVNEKEYIPAASNMSFISRSERYLLPRDLGIASLLLIELMEREARKVQ